MERKLENSGRSEFLRKSSPKFFEIDGTLGFDLRVVAVEKPDDQAFIVAKEISSANEEKLQQITRSLEFPSPDNRFAIEETKRFLSLMRDPNKINPHFQFRMREILSYWIDLPSDEIGEFINRLGYKEEVAFRLYRVRQFAPRVISRDGDKIKTNNFHTVQELEADPILKIREMDGLDHGGVLAIVALFIEESQIGQKFL